MFWEKKNNCTTRIYNIVYVYINYYITQLVFSLYPLFTLHATLQRLSVSVIHSPGLCNVVCLQQYMLS